MVFRFAKTLDPITLFHAPHLPSSKSALSILQRASTTAASTTGTPRGEFQLEVSTAPPTNDQLRNILEYVSGSNTGSGAGIGKVYGVGEVVRGARDAEDAIKRFKADPEGSFVRPITVDWTKGQAVVGDNESEILKMVQELE
ncbi:hypothetical protein BO83DRAFT_416395 [Aspergillus eucalypticola CBS 122712]|uniref:Thioredoxin-like protein n=1 Tax=Aspergillus eucalypticola (strain CBS 122712 / IBT 29274) TaxID=1448314 RepID=A0A317VPH2_ASPEC|nr:uncharacterized protein BO83DRAFT_416395 [Aspergillus eucalypticola CBS 122712]PWY75825.1 hypothetical protein BO83DRAFT_416395 [Aspergillus eucalypticola CBS 122712]